MTLIVASAVIRVIVWVLVLVLAYRFDRPLTVFVAGLVALANLMVVGDQNQAAALIGTVASGGLAWLLIDRMQYTEGRRLPRSRRSRR